MAQKRMFNCSRVLWITLLFLMPVYANAHVRWFVPDADYSQAYLPTDSVAIVMVIGILFLGLVARWITATNVLPLWIQGFCRLSVRAPHALLWHILACVICIFLLVHLLEGGFIAPNLTLPTHLQKVGVILQSIVLLMVPISVSLFGLGLALLGLSLYVLFPSGLAMDYVFEFFGIGFTLFLIGPSLNRLDKKWADSLSLNIDELRALAVTVLRVCLGIQLAVLALHNKMFNPGIALAFLDAYPIYNFFSLLPFDGLTPNHFVLFVGLSELLLGLMLAFGLANRIVQAVLFVVFSLTSYVAGIEELIGHLPILAVLAVLLSESVNSSSTSKQEREDEEREDAFDEEEFLSDLNETLAPAKPAAISSFNSSASSGSSSSLNSSSNSNGSSNFKGSRENNHLIDEEELDYQWDEDKQNQENARQSRPTLVPVLTEDMVPQAEHLPSSSRDEETQSELLIVEKWDNSIMGGT